jgi:N-acetylglucosaminyldiphosphoundecaprenol N-acetyl-beta-D-mannosaminyltransferase
MKWPTFGKTKFISAVPQFSAYAMDHLPPIAPARLLGRDPLLSQPCYSLANHLLVASDTLTMNPDTASILFPAASRLSAVEARSTAGQMDAPARQRSKADALPMCEVIGAPVTALPFNAQMDLIVTWAKRRLSKMVCVANAHMLVEAHWNAEFAAVLRNADLVTSDGMPIVWMMKLLGIKTQNRVAGMEILLALCHLSLQSNLKVFFLGCERSILDRMRARLDRDFPGLDVVGMEPLPFRPMTAAEEEEILATIAASGANLVFVSLGCPKQEYWMVQHRDRVQAVMLGLGGAFPVYAGLKKWAPRWIREAGLEWAYRLLQEPRRLAGRYGKTNQVFLWLALKQFLRIGFEQVFGKAG